METNLNTETNPDLHAAASALLAAAYAFWEVHKRNGNGRAVVWLTDTDGKLVIFTRGEYRGYLMERIGHFSDEIPL